MIRVAVVLVFSALLLVACVIEVKPEEPVPIAAVPTSTLEATATAIATATPTPTPRPTVLTTSTPRPTPRATTRPISTPKPDPLGDYAGEVCPFIMSAEKAIEETLATLEILSATGDHAGIAALSSGQADVLQSVVLTLQNVSVPPVARNYHEALLQYYEARVSFHRRTGQWLDALVRMASISTSAREAAQDALAENQSLVDEARNRLRWAQGTEGILAALTWHDCAGIYIWPTVN